LRIASGPLDRAPPNDRKLDTKSCDGYPPRARRQQQIHREHPILAPTFYDFAGLNEHFVVADIFDRQLVDAAGFIDS